MMKTFFLAPIPSISVKSWLITLSAAPPEKLSSVDVELQSLHEQGVYRLSTVTQLMVTEGCEQIM